MSETRFLRCYFRCAAMRIAITVPYTAGIITSQKQAEKLAASLLAAPEAWELAKSETIGRADV